MYDGFLSYSHAADEPAGAEVAGGVATVRQAVVEAVSIFRDESSSSANPHLWSSIIEALDSSPGSCFSSHQTTPGRSGSTGEIESGHCIGHRCKCPTLEELRRRWRDVSRVSTM